MAIWVFSGTLTEKMAERLDREVDKGNFVPTMFLVTQIDRSGQKQMINFKQKYKFIDSLVSDSGAFSIHTGKANTTTDEYIEYVNPLDEHFSVIAQLDTIPGKFGQPKTKEDYERSAELSWENYLYMRDRVKSPDKLMPIFHFGESFDALTRMLDYRDPSGKPLSYIGISPANDAHQEEKNIYLRDVYEHISKSSNPTVKTHLYGMTSLDALSKFPAYSADSISARLLPGYNKIYTPKWGVISLSDRPRTSKSKSNMAFDKVCSPEDLEELKALCAKYDYTLEEMKSDNVPRVVLTMCEIQKANMTTYQYHPTNNKKQRRLFSIA